DIEQQPVEQSPYALVNADSQRSGMPRLHSYFPTPDEVAFEAFGHGQAEQRIQGLEVGFQIPAQIPVIEVARANTDPVIHKHDFQMQEVWLIFVNSHAGAKQSRVITLAGIAHRGMVGITT